MATARRFRGSVSRRSFLQYAALAATAAPATLAQSAATSPAPVPSPFFPGFRSLKFKGNEATISGVVGGSGPPVLLLHGWPQTHLIWQKIAPALAKEFTVICTDLRGYGDSSTPADGN